MTIIHGQTTIEYGLTPGGCFIEHHRGKNFGVTRSTPSAEQFLRWIISTEVSKDIERQRRERLVHLITPFWEEAEEGKRYGGSFNKELYFKYIQKRIDDGTLQY